MATLGTVLKGAREKAGLSQAEVARKLGRTQPLVTKWESDKCSPALGDSDDVAKVYGVSARKLRALIIERIESRRRAS